MTVLTYQRPKEFKVVDWLSIRNVVLLSNLYKCGKYILERVDFRSAFQIRLDINV